jgi:hypothetical protein
MDYQLVYNKIVANAMRENREKGKGVYYETHHVIPRCCGGDNSKSNLVNLTSKEHFICHLLLCHIYPDNKKLQYALWCMCNQQSSKQQRYKPSARLYEYTRKLRYKLKNPKSYIKWQNAVIGNVERSQKISKALKGRPSPRKGCNLSQSHKSNISKARLGQSRDLEAIEKSVLGKRRVRESRSERDKQNYTLQMLTRHISVEDIKIIISEYKAGSTLNTLRLRYNKSYPTIRRILQLENLFG